MGFADLRLGKTTCLDAKGKNWEGGDTGVFCSMSLFPKSGFGCVAGEEYPDPPCLPCIPLMYGSYIKGGKVLNEPSLFSIN